MPRWIRSKMIPFASPSNCEICSNPNREFEQQPEIKEAQPSPKQLRDDFHKTQVLVNDLMNRMNTHIGAGKKKEEHLYR